MRHTHFPGANRQRGSVILFAALGISMGVIMLSITNIGFLYYYKREYQKTADLAALAGAAELWDRTASRCGAAVSEATDLINQNLVGRQHDTPGPEDVQCGIWASGDGFAANTGASANAVRATVRGTPPRFLSFFPPTVIKAEAIAIQQAPLASFSIGSTVIDVSNDSPLGVVLGAVGIPLEASLIGYNGLANAQVSASGLLQALGLPLDLGADIGTVNDLLVAEQVSLGFLLDTALTLAGHNELLGLNAQLLSLLSAKLGLNAANIQIPLGTPPGGDGVPGLFASIVAPDATTGSALDVGVNVLDIIAAAVGVGTSGHAVSIPNLSVAIPGVLPNLLRIQSGIIEPPSIAIGGVGATAYNAQVRLYADIDTAGGLVGGLLELLGTRIHLPLFVDIGRAKGTITDIVCEVPHRESTATIRVESSVAELCVGKADGDPFSTRTPICDTIGNETLISVLGLIKVHNHISLDLLDADSDYYDYTLPQESPPLRAGESWTTPGNPINLGSTVAQLVDELLRLLGELLGSPTQTAWTGAENEAAAQSLADYYLGIGADSLGSLPVAQLGLLGPDGAYNTHALVDRLNADINRDSQGCLLGLICWPTNDWTNWANGVGYYSGLSDAIIGGSCWLGAGITGPLANQGNVDSYNSCIRNELTSELLDGPTSDNPNFLQVLLDPLLDLLGALLDPVGNLLGSVLDDLLGIQLGKNDVEMIAVGCGQVGLVE
ncbi:MAG: pilus assembly protein TadG-related protein [Nevskiales bacterium]|nr:pilus assembly protein TadG-related protein [Nevskiales bacterium]